MRISNLKDLENKRPLVLLQKVITLNEINSIEASKDALGNSLITLMNTKSIPSTIE